jgi:DNA anti-recombination protein RmuC
VDSEASKAATAVDLAAVAAQLEGLRQDARRREALLERREAQVRDLSAKLAEAMAAGARQRAHRMRAEAQLERITGSRFWPLLRSLYALRRKVRRS